MNKFAIPLFVSLLAAMEVTAPTGVQAAPADEAAIKALEGRFTSAFNAKDVDAIMKIYIPSDSLVVFDVVPPRQYVGAKAYRKNWEDFFAMFKGPAKVELSDISIIADTALGFGHSIQHVTGTDTKGQPIDVTVRVTDGYRKINGNWLIVHEHVSIPVYIGTLKPDPSSKP